MAQRRMWQACVTGILVLAASFLMSGQAPAAGISKPDISVLLATHMQGAGLLNVVGAQVFVSGPPGDQFGLEVAQQGTKRLAAPQVAVDRFRIDLQPRRHALEDADQSGPVRLAGGQEPQHDFFGLDVDRSFVC
jgi:hypothetical protein